MTDHIRARTDLETRAMEDTLVILDPRTQRYLSLNRSGTGLWDLVAAGTTCETLVETLRARYGLSDTQAQQDVDALVGQLRESGLLQVEDGRVAQGDATAHG
jgi:hypothetical protein